MDLRLVEEISEAWHLAGRVCDDLPKIQEPLKNGMLPIMCTLRRLQDEEGTAKVTDISTYLHLKPPGVVKIIGQCEKVGLIEKSKDSTDKRVTNIRLTEEGNKVLERSLDVYNTMLMERFKEIDDADWKTFVRLMQFCFDVSSDVGRQLNDRLPDWRDDSQE